MAYVIAERASGQRTPPVSMPARLIASIRRGNTSYNDSRPGFDEFSQLYIDPVECIDCGACVPVCPLSAIFPLGDLPEKWKQYTELNASYVQSGKSIPESLRNISPNDRAAGGVSYKP